MEREEIFRVLGIEPTKDEGAIKQAYRVKLAVTNPEDNPEGFKRLRQAYEGACAYAKESDEVKEPEVDNSPSGKWVAQAKEIYKDIRLRRDVKVWEELFDEEIFLSLEGEEECREKLLAFMMDNFYFPTDVWKLLDEKLRIQADKSNLKEIFPADFISYIVGRCQRGEEFDFELFEGALDADYDAYIQYYVRCWNYLGDGDTKLAQDMYDEAKALPAYHPLMDMMQAIIYRDRQEFDKAVALMETVYEKYPDDLGIAYNYGDLCWKAEAKEKAVEAFLKIKEKDKGHYMSNYYLAIWYFEKEDFAEAKECGKIVMSYGAGDEFFQMMKDINEKLMEKYRTDYGDGDLEAGMKLAWCLLQNEEYYASMKLGRELEGKIEKNQMNKCYSLLSKAYFELAMYEEVLETALLWRQAVKEKMPFDAGEDLEKDEDEIYQSYAIRAESYHQLGLGKAEYFKDALKELEDLSTVEELGARMLTEKARIYIDSNEADKSIEIADALIDDRQFGAYALLLLAYKQLRDADGVINASQACNHFFPQYAPGYDEVAKVFLDFNEEENFKAVLEAAHVNGVESQMLEAYEYLMKNEVPEEPPFKERLDKIEEEYVAPFKEKRIIELYEPAYVKVTELLYQYPSNYMLIERGLLALAALDYDRAKKDFLKVLERTPNEQFALNNLGCVYKYTGENDKAMACFKRAIYFMDDEPNMYPYGNLGDMYERLGEYEEAIRIYELEAERFEKNKFNSSGMVDDLVGAYTNAGRIEDAVKFAEKNRYNKNWVDNDVEFYSEMFDIYMNANMMEAAAGELANMEKAYDRLPKEERNKYAGNMIKDAAWYSFVTGDYHKAQKRMRYILNNKAILEHISRETVIEELLYMLTSAEDAFMPELEDNGFFSKLMKKAGNAKLESTQHIAESLGKEMVEFIKESTDPKKGNKYLYRQRVASWMNFLGVYFTQGIDGVKKAYEDMLSKPRCRACNNKECYMKLLAEALILEKQGKKQEALLKYRDMSEKYPDSKYARAKLLYLDK